MISVNNCLLNALYGPGMRLDAGDLTVNKTDSISDLMELTLQDGLKWLLFQVLQNCT